MRYGKAFFWMLAAVLVAAPLAWAQPAVPEFYVDVVGVRGDAGSDETRVDVYTKIPFTNLHFVRTSGGFRAEYQVTAEFYELQGNGRRGNRVHTQVWERPVAAEEFAMTQSEKLFDAATQSLAFPPGRYLLELQIEDQVSGHTALTETSFLVRDLDKPLAISDLIIIDAYDPEKNTISPNVGNRVSTDTEGFRFFYELYAREATDARIVSEVIKMKTPPSGPSIRTLFGMDRDEDLFGEVAYVRPENTSLRRGRQAVVSEIPLSGIGAGQYLLRVSVEDEDGTVLDRAEKVVTAQWTGLAEHIQNLEDAIAQLQYIAKDRDVRYIRDGATPAERAARFREFWKKRDPTPSTDRNENMEEYYYRISFANERYGSLIDGWRTDRGNVLVRFGEPDFIERRPYNFDVEPYEVWYYYRLGKRFIFIDKTGLGDYELWVPIWDERNRIR